MGIADPQTLSPELIGRLRSLKPKYQVILHNDEVNDLRRAAEILTQEIRLSWQEALRIVREAHTQGRATVGVWVWEEALRYCRRLRFRGLTSTVEEA